MFEASLTACPIGTYGGRRTGRAPDATATIAANRIAPDEEDIVTAYLDKAFDL